MIKTKYGDIEGVDQGTYIEYRGIPYAKAPVGELRWRAPQKPEPWEGILQATEFGRCCMQESHADPFYGREFHSNPQFERQPGEDCLLLHIWAPKEADHCPVAFWIHGGAFMGGHSSELEFDGAAYCKRGVIFVSVEYRCNIFGFLAHPWLTMEAGTSGNYGILDQIAALEWVYENIEAFGGDQDNITAFGQSAGAMSVQTLVSSPLTGNIIRRAILQSGGSYGSGLHRDITLQEQEEYGKIFTDLMGAKNLSDLRAKTAEEILSAVAPFMEKVLPITKGLFLVPVIDGKLLSEGYYKTMDEGKFQDIPYLLGSTKNDILAPENVTDREQSPLYQGCLGFAQKLEELGRTPAYIYYFKRDLPGDEAGAWHSSELWYMMGTQDRCWRTWTDEDRRLSDQMLDYWVNFMRTGDPNGKGLELWNPYTKNHSFVMELTIQ